MTQDQIKRRALYWFSGLAVASTLLTVGAVAALASGMPKMAILLLCPNVAIPGLAVSKYLETSYLWRGLDGDAGSENRAAIPGVLSLIAALGVAYFGI